MEKLDKKIKEEILSKVDRTFRENPKCQECAVTVDGNVWQQRHIQSAEQWSRINLKDESETIYLINRKGEVRISTIRDRRPGEKVPGKRVGNLYPKQDDLDDPDEAPQITLNRLALRVEEKEAELIKLKDSYEALTAEFEKAEADMERLQKTAETNRDTLAKTQAEVEEASGKLKTSLTAQIKDLEQKLTESQADEAALQAQIQTLTSHLQVAAMGVRTTEELLEKFQQEMEDLKPRLQ